MHAPAAWRNVSVVLRIGRMVRTRSGREWGRGGMIIVAVFAAGVFVYLIYALLHPEKF
jgi:K+-transporting ATPase KdpF subunit